MADDDNYNYNDEQQDDQAAYGDDDQSLNNYDANGDARVCMIYDHNDFFTVFVQMLLAAFALGSLYIKRMQEIPRRKFSTWAYDVSKQGVGACYAHLCNMFIAAILSNNIDGTTQLKDQCAWYAISYLIDTTLGLVLAILFVWWLDDVANKYNWVSLKHSGVYTGPSAFYHFFNQTLAWIVILTIVKVLIYYFMVFCAEPLAFFGGLLFEPLQVNIRFELLFVMILFPGLLNVIYFWIADSYLKAHTDDPENNDAFDQETLTESASIQSKKQSLLSEEDKEIAAELATRSSRNQTLEEQEKAAIESGATPAATNNGGAFGFANSIPGWSYLGSAGAQVTEYWGQTFQTDAPISNAEQKQPPKTNQAQASV